MYDLHTTLLINQRGNVSHGIIEFGHGASDVFLVFFCLFLFFVGFFARIYEVRTHFGIAYRLVGLVVKASASRAEGPGFESCLRRDFFGVKSYQ